MTHQLTIPDPKVLAGIALVVFGGWLALEGALMLSMGQLLIAAVFVSVGWFLRKRGAAMPASTGLRRWLRVWAVALPVLLGVYVLGYFVLMDRH
jgi:hypothetical protein